MVNYDGEVYSTGRNDRGQLGLGDIAQRYVPARIPDFNVSTLCCGALFTICISSNDGGLYGFGKLSCLAECATKPTKLLDQPLAIGAGYSSMFVETSDGILCSGINDNGQLGIKAIREVK